MAYNPFEPYDDLPLQEAKASSEIENIVTTNDTLYKTADIPYAATDPLTKEVLRCRTALYRGYERIKTEPVSLGLVRDLCFHLREKGIDFQSPNQNVRIGNRTSGDRNEELPKVLSS